MEWCDWEKDALAWDTCSFADTQAQTRHTDIAIFKVLSTSFRLVVSACYICASAHITMIPGIKWARSLHFQCDESPISFWSHFYTILDYIFIDTLIEVYLSNFHCYYLLRSFALLPISLSLRCSSSVMQAKVWLYKSKRLLITKSF